MKNALIIGEKVVAEELKKKLPEGFEAEQRFLINDSILGKFDLIFDLQFDSNPDNLQYYAPMSEMTIIVGAVKKQLADVYASYHGEITCNLIGMNTLPTFIDRSLLEFSVYNELGKKKLDNVARKFKWEYTLVNDRVGMVTPRVVLMIINEAAFTLQEGTATIKDIDKGMKLGTGYPYGPFEWADKIGIDNVYETLISIFEDTGDQRYKICPLLKSKYLRAERFYQ